MTRTIRIFTAGFTRKSAEHFFTMLRTAGVRRLLDVRLNNTSQLAGFAKKDDLAYFTRTILGIDYQPVPDLAPTQDMLDAFKKARAAWAEYEAEFLALMSDRRIEHTCPRDLLDSGCLLCSEHEPDHCHRRLVAEYLRDHWGHVDIIHLM